MSTKTDLSFFGMNLIEPLANPWPYMSTPVCRLLAASDGGTAIQWQMVETARGVYNWTNMDALIAQSVAKGVRIIYVFVNVPGWANGNAGQAVPPTDFADLTNFAIAVATRYAGKGIIYELWNEMNLPDTWTGTVQQMVTLASNLYPAIHAADATAIVTTPSVSNFSGLAYMDQFLALGGGAYADALNIHGYPICTTPSQFPEQTWNMMQSYAAMFTYYGQSSKPLYVSEGSWANSSGNITTSASQQAYVPIYLLMLAAGGATFQAWWSWDFPGQQVDGTLYDSTSLLTPAGVAYNYAEIWLDGVTFTQAPTRQANTNGIRNPGGAGAVLPSTPPTNWSVSVADGISWSVVGTGTEGGIPYVDLRFSGTPTASGFASIHTETANHIVASNGQMWTFSVNTRLVAGTAAGIGWGLGYAENNSSGTFLNNPLSFQCNMFPYPLASQQQSYAGINIEASTAFVQPYLFFSYTQGVAFDQTVRIGNATMDNGSIWTANLSRQNGFKDQIVWDANGGPTTYTVPTGYKSVRTITGGTSAAGATVTLTNIPIMLEG